MEAYGPPATAANAGETPPSNGLLDARGHSVVNIAGMVEAKASASSRSCKNESSLCLQECGFSSFQREGECQNRPALCILILHKCGFLVNLGQKRE
jgi:hypothetical protein